jgi:integrase
MIALLALDPIRLKNYASLEIGCTFQPSEGAWWIVLEDTKAGRPDHRPVPTFLNCHLASYLNVHRPVLLSSAARRSDVLLSRDMVAPPATGEPISALWIGVRGEPLTYGAVERIITDTTKKTLGVAVNPHWFRKADASFAALNAPSSPYLGSALLQHADPKETYEHYIRASSLSASQDFANLIAKLRKPIV